MKRLCKSLFWLNFEDLFECSRHRKKRSWDKLEADKDMKWAWDHLRLDWCSISQVCLASCPCVVHLEDWDTLREAFRSPRTQGS